MAAAVFTPDLVREFMGAAATAALEVCGSGSIESDIPADIECF